MRLLTKLIASTAVLAFITGCSITPSESGSPSGVSDNSSLSKAIVTISGLNDTVWITSTSHAYQVQNNVWGASTAQTLQVDDQTGDFTVTASAHNNSTTGSPASYPSIYKGNHFGTSTTGSGMPILVSGIGSVNTSWSITTAAGYYNCAYDIWFAKSANVSSPDGAELMIWINHQGPPQPAGTIVASNITIAGATWNVWYSQMSWNYIAYVRTSVTTSVNFDVKPFIQDCVSRGYIQNAWYLIGVEAGFEIWQAGTGLKSTGFSCTVTGGSSSTPSSSSRSSAISSAVSSSRSSVASSSRSSAVSSSRSSAASSSSRSSAVSSVSGGYAVNYNVSNDWGTGATVTVTMKNNSASALSSWTLVWTFAGTQKITQIWNATQTTSGATVTAKNLSYNGTIGANGGTQAFGFNLSYTGSNAKPAAFTLNGTACALY